MSAMMMRQSAKETLGSVLLVWKSHVQQGKLERQQGKLDRLLGEVTRLHASQRNAPNMARILKDRKVTEGSNMTEVAKEVCGNWHPRCEVMIADNGRCVHRTSVSCSVGKAGNLSFGTLLHVPVGASTVFGLNSLAEFGLLEATLGEDSDVAQFLEKLSQSELACALKLWVPPAPQTQWQPGLIAHARAPGTQATVDMNGNYAHESLSVNAEVYVVCQNQVDRDILHLLMEPAANLGSESQVASLPDTDKDSNAGSEVEFESTDALPCDWI